MKVLGFQERKGRLDFLAALAAIVGLVPTLDAAQLRKLNSPLSGNRDVARFSIAADGTHALYVADHTDEQFELYSVRLDVDAAPVKLNGPLPAGQDVVFELSSRQHVVFGAAQPGNPSVQLQSVPIDGGMPIVLNPPLVAGGNVTAAKVTPDGTRVVYMGDQDVDGATELYVVTIDGSSSAIQLSHELTGTYRVTSFTLDPAGTQAAYVVEQDPTLAPQLYVVPLDGSASPVLLASHTGWTATGATFSPDGQWITYSYKNHSATPWSTHLYLVPVDGSRASLRLNDNFGLTGYGFANEGVFTAAPERVVVREYDYYYSGTGFPLFVNDSFLFSSNLEGTAVTLNQGSGINVLGYLIDRDGRFVYYWGGSQGVRQVPADGSDAPVQIAPDHAQLFALSGDGTRVVYVTREPTGNNAHLGLYALPLAGDTPSELHLAPTGKSFDSIQVSTNSRFVAYRLGTTSSRELYGAEIDGGSPPKRLHDALPSNRSIESYQLAGGRIHGRDVTLHPAGARVVFSGDLDTNNVTELYLSSLGPVEGASKSAAPTMQPAGD